jgi:hypothetical protein
VRGSPPQPTVSADHPHPPLSLLRRCDLSRDKLVNGPDSIFSALEWAPESAHVFAS